MSENPYSAPLTSPPPLVFGAQLQGDAVTIRQAHIKHEASVKSIGVLYFLGAFFFSIGMLGGLAELRSDPAKRLQTIGLLVFCAALAVLMILGGLSIRKLKQSGRVIGICLSSVGLLAFPLGTLINAYILYLLVSKKGSTVFSPDYKAIIAATPEVKYKTSKWIWIILGIVLLVILSIAVLAFLIPAK